MDYNGNPLPEWKPYTGEEKTVLKFKDVPVSESLEECPVLDFRLAFGKKVFADR